MKRDTLTLTKPQNLTLAALVFGVAVPLALTGIGAGEAKAAPLDVVVAPVEKRDSRVEEMRKLLAAIKVRDINFTEATLEEGVDFLRRMAQNQGGAGINFVILRSARSGSDSNAARLGQQRDVHTKRRAEAKQRMRQLEAEHGFTYDLAMQQFRAANNAIVQLDSDQLQADAGVGTVTLQLKDVSLAAALKYMAQLAGVEVAVQPEAVVLGSREEIDALEGRKRKS